MADQDYIRRTVEELVVKFQLAQEEAISAMLGLVEGKTNAEAIAILNKLDIGVVMSYPNLASILLKKKVQDKEESASEQMFGMIQDCMLQIWQGEETFAAMDYTDKDKRDFIESLNHNQFEKIQQFFETMPTVKHEVEVTNPKTQVVSKVELEGMNSFF